MPWLTGEGYASKHNKKLKGAAAQKAADMATAMVKNGVPEGIALATANKHGDKMMRGKPADAAQGARADRTSHRMRKRSPLHDHPRSP